MKMSARSYIFGLFLILASLVQPVYAQDLLPSYPQMSAYDHYAAYDKSGDVYLFDGDTNTEKKISTHNSSSGYAGITVLSTGVYWGEWQLGADVYFYDFSTEQTNKLVSLASVGDMEKNNGLGQFRMLSQIFFEYSLLKPGKDSIYSNMKYYNIKSQKVYGQTGFNTATEIYGDKYEVFRLNSNEKFGAGNIYNFSAVSVEANDLLMYGYGNDNSGTKAGEYVQYRSHNLSNGMTLKFNDDSQKNIAYAGFIKPNNQFSYTNFVLGSISTDSGGLIQSYYRLDKKSPYTFELIKTVSNSQLVAYGADSLVWVEKNGGQTWYRTDDKKICTLSKQIPTAVDQRVTTRSYFFWKDYGNGMVVKGQKFVCAGDTTTQSVVTPIQPTAPAPVTKTAPTTSKILIKSKTSPSIYYLGADGKRYIFYNADIYSTWYKNFSSVKTILLLSIGITRKK